MRPNPLLDPLLGADIIYWTAGDNAGEIAPRAGKIIHIHNDGTVSLIMWTPYGDPVTHVGIHQGTTYGTYSPRTPGQPERTINEEE